MQKTNNRKNSQKRGNYHQFHKSQPKHEEKDFGDFADVGNHTERFQNNNLPNLQAPQQNFFRVRTPRQNQVIGVIEQRLGGARMMIACSDKITRNCRVPGRLKRELWLRPGDVVLVELWEFDKNKGDIVYKYNPSAIEWLKKNGYLKKGDNEF